MGDMNSVTLTGRLAGDAELKSTASGQTVCRFTVAVNRSVKKGDGRENEAGFFDVNLWGKLGESLKQYLTKGKQVAVSGELRQERWEQDGNKRSRVLIVAGNVQLLGGNGNRDGNSGGRDDDVGF